LENLHIWLMIKYTQIYAQQICEDPRAFLIWEISGKTFCEDQRAFQSARSAGKKSGKPAHLADD